MSCPANIFSPIGSTATKHFTNINVIAILWCKTQKSWFSIFAGRHFWRVFGHFWTPDSDTISDTTLQPLIIEGSLCPFRKLDKASHMNKKSKNWLFRASRVSTLNISIASVWIFISCTVKNLSLSNNKLNELVSSL